MKEELEELTPEEIEAARARITVPRPLSFLPLLTVILLIGVVIGFLMR
ncbi:hypothetical protein [Parasphingopyxis marina]|uniref:Uncharacterized protein n=1 Tax=Parasphingopyxis marina TaxID=2761622 RepID=A0A842HVX7_9SPHN|nr:hypothetical protein [Parasphingopyxis marina]MBC2776100.1 hypothetical protein [Parasphingopyxis marina]